MSRGNNECNNRLARAVCETLERRQLLSAGATTAPVWPLAPAYHFSIKNTLTPDVPVQKYSFSLASPLRTSVALSAAGGDLDVRLYHGKTLRAVSATAGTSNESLARTLLPGQYTIVVSSASAAATPYTLLLNTAAVASPTRVEAQALGGNAVRVNWLDQSDNESGFAVKQWRKHKWNTVARVPAGATAAVVRNLPAGAAMTFSVSALSSEGSGMSANGAFVQTDSTDTTGWYKITSLGGMTQGEAAWTKESDTLGIASDYQDKWFYADSWEDAVYQAVAGTAKVKKGDGDIVSHDFPSGGDFWVATVGDLHDQIDDNDLAGDDAQKVIALEDSYGDVDEDYDDFFWTVTTEFAPLKTFSLQVSTFIKQEYVWDPESWNSDSYFSSLYAGDNRTGAGGQSIFDKTSQNYRTRQILTITPLDANDSDGIVDGSIQNRTGITTLFDTDTSLDLNEHITAQARGDNIIDAFEYAWNRNGMLLDIGQAGTDRMLVSGSRIAPMKVKYTFDMASNNPLIWTVSPDIDYDLELIVDFSDPYNPGYQMTGSHDGFPCYEFYIDDTLIYSHDSGSQTILSLFPP